MSKHTPGPWIATHSRVESRLENVWVNEGCWIADCRGPDAEANARLIASAPTMKVKIKKLRAQVAGLLIALQVVDRLLSDPNADEFDANKVAKIVNDAIAKAEGA